MPLRSLRNSAAPSSCCLPPAASGPVRTVRKPILSGSADCANTRPEGRTPIAAPAFSNVRRDMPDCPVPLVIAASSLITEFYDRLLLSGANGSRGSLSALPAPLANPRRARSFPRAQSAPGFLGVCRVVWRLARAVVRRRLARLDVAASLAAIGDELGH